ncbi:MAG: hypothetical protein ACYCRG_00105 [Acidimicrobiales bacterium]
MSESELIRDHRLHAIVVGPGLALTIPGVIVTELVRALSRRALVTRIEVDLSEEVLTGLHRAPSLASVQRGVGQDRMVTLRAPMRAKDRARALRQWVDNSADLLIAYVWPGLDIDWLDDLLKVGRLRRVPTVVLCASLPGVRTSDLAALCSRAYGADRVFVGRTEDARTLRSLVGARGARVEVHPSLALTGRSSDECDQVITAFLPRDNVAALATVLTAFDAVPDEWINDRRLRIVMRHRGHRVEEAVGASHHAAQVELIDEEITESDLFDVVGSSAAIGIADPTDASRALDVTMDRGVATVAMVSSPAPALRRGYAGGLVASLARPASVHVAFSHALRLASLRFPSPDDWDALVRSLVRQATVAEVPVGSHAPR